MIDYFSETRGFGQHKTDAINLLHKTIDILEEFDINYFLISGTLLGYIRHNDFIPWDDDIDLLVDSSIYHKLTQIADKYSNLNIFHKHNTKYDAIKICNKSDLELEDDEESTNWKNSSISKDNKFCWPFIDLFVYESGPGIHNCASENDKEPVDGFKFRIFNPFRGLCKRPFRFFSKNEISFFHNEWNKSEFFPLKSISFLDVKCNIPNNPDYFLRNNFGKDYMTNFKPPRVVHKKLKIK